MPAVTGFPDSFSRWQACRIVASDRYSGAILCDRVLIVSLLVFGLAIPHSIAAAQISYLTGLILWLIRNAICARRDERPPSSSDTLFSSTQPTDWISRPLIGFVLLTILSSLLSYSPAISLLRSRSLGLFVVFYLLVLNLTRRGAIGVVCCLLLSSLIGVGYSLGEKISGRGMVIEYLEPAGPLAGHGLHPGDVIWMIGRRRVRSLEEARRVIAEHDLGDRLGVEVLRAGDPVPPIPVQLTVTEELRRSTSALGVRTAQSTRQFRVSGFGRQFITYAEQMQLMGLLLFGLLLTVAGRGGRWWPWSLAGLILFSTGLILTATRSVIASFVLAMVLATLHFGKKRAIGLALIGAVLIAGIGIRTVTSARREAMGRFRDESTSRRFGYMRAGLGVALGHPLLGVGIDSHKQFWKEWGFPGDYVTHTHSTLIQVAMDRGLLALACLVWMGVAVWIGLGRIRKRSLEASDYLGAGLASGAMAALLGFSLSALINYNFGDSETLLQLLTIIGAAGAAGDAEHAGETPDHPSGGIKGAGPD